MENAPSVPVTVLRTDTTPADRSAGSRYRSAHLYSTTAPASRRPDSASSTVPRTRTPRGIARSASWRPAPAGHATSMASTGYGAPAFGYAVTFIAGPGNGWIVYRPS